MLSIDPKNQTERENYKFLIGSIIPRPIAFITSESEEGVLNGAPFSFFNIVSSNPPMISVGIQRKAGKMKDTARNITTKKEFVVHVVSEEFVEKINETAANLPANESEIERARLTPVDSLKVSVAGIQEAKVRFECVLEHALPLGGDDNGPGVDLIIATVVQFHIEEDVYSDGYIDPQKLAAVSRLAGNDYATIGNITTIERPQ